MNIGKKINSIQIHSMSENLKKIHSLNWSKKVIVCGTFLKNIIVKYEKRLSLINRKMSYVVKCQKSDSMSEKKEVIV